MFGAFVDDQNPGSTSWLKVYYLLAIMSFAAFALLSFAKLDESRITPSTTKSPTEDFIDMMRLCIKPLVLIFVVCAFLYVLIEQSIMTWLPTFNSKILNLPASLSIQMASILAMSYALGRFLAGIVLQRLSWFKVLFVGLVLAGILVLVVLPAAGSAGDREITSWLNAPMAAFVFPLIGLCIAPVYPAINSVVLSALPARQHAPMAGLIVVFSALGGTTGSIVTGHLFEAFGGITAFYFSLVPISALLFALYLFKRSTDGLSSVRSEEFTT